MLCRAVLCAARCAVCCVLCALCAAAFVAGSWCARQINPPDGAQTTTKQPNNHTHTHHRPKKGEILLEKRYDSLSAADAHLQRISDHVSAYLQIVRSQLLATVPKAVVHCTVVPAKESLLQGLQEEIAGKEEAALRRLLNENEDVARQRDALRKKLELMERASQEIMHFRV